MSTFTPTTTVNRPSNAQRTVIISVDGSDHSKYAFRWSLNNIIRSEEGAHDWVVLVTCMKSELKKDEIIKGSKWAEVPVSSSKQYDELEAAERSRLQNMLLTYQSELHSKNIPSKIVYLKGDPKDALVGKAEQLSSDLMIMGSRGMSGLKKAFMGSVSDYCVHHASCPVLIVRKPNH